MRGDQQPQLPPQPLLPLLPHKPLPLQQKRMRIRMMIQQQLLPPKQLLYIAQPPMKIWANARETALGGLNP